ncbi:hypothetical protein BDQ12DRAFT_688029 [Crucibulum laeve]|uniref:Uncharacterized protein n=1 Tax=Crucibulum laeve TaxID=68775 RepID=A0A5C3LSP4_9AGAR|nr:hypothetical protein BDQ12DRAFT_688029 [Crucibulum laeve]
MSFNKLENTFPFNQVYKHHHRHAHYLSTITFSPLDAFFQGFLVSFAFSCCRVFIIDNLYTSPIVV